MGGEWRHRGQLHHGGEMRRRDWLDGRQCWHKYVSLVACSYTGMVIFRVAIGLLVRVLWLNSSNAEL